MSVAVSKFPVMTRIQTRSGPLKAPFYRVTGTNVIVLTGKYLEFKPGTIFVPNKELERWSPKGTTHMAFEHLYEAFRSGEHAIRRSGSTPRSKHGEMRDIREDIRTARAYVECLVASGLLSAEEEMAAQGAIAELIGRYQAVRNDHKKAAREQFHRSRNFKDKRGRRNPAAAGFVTGSGIGHLLGRHKEILGISFRVDRRTIQIFQAIETHMELYKELRAATKPVGALPAGIIMQLYHAPDMNEHVFVRLYQTLGHFRYSLRQIVAQPFRKNAFHTADDLAKAMEYARAKDPPNLGRTIDRLRRGITWVFAQYALEMEVTTPLSFLLEHHAAALRRAQRKAGVKKAIRIVRAMDEFRFARIEFALDSFLKKLDQCSDQDLATPIKGGVLNHCLEARTLMQTDEWVKAKDELKKASALM